ncbi:MAG: HNH endonuclease signature motif containing protein, partial [Geminicoccaceae bacterium]
YRGRPEREEDTLVAKMLIDGHRNIVVRNNSGHVAIDSPGTIQAHTVNVKATRQRVTFAAPPGTIGADQQASRYVQYLIRRYNEFAASDTPRTGFSYGAISRSIVSVFGAEWRLLPVEKADALFNYLHSRINRTRLARINKGKGRRSFSTHQEFIAKHGA